MSDTISSADPDPIRRSAPSAGGELPTSAHDADPQTVGGGPVSTPPPTPTPPDGAPEDPTLPDAAVGDAAGEALPDGVIPEADGGLIETDAAMGGEDTVDANDLLDGGEVDRGD